mmetsp:Transcript_9131/g.27413  ORF Transcript_9131/g.27413 Transcript_9131/m.27413 type:complete len:89 (+) Transcript_9131:83-349(+)
MCENITVILCQQTSAYFCENPADSLDYRDGKLYLLLCVLLCCSKHTILHQPSIKCTVHPFKAVTIPYTFEILVRLENKATRIINTNPD